MFNIFDYWGERIILFLAFENPYFKNFSCPFYFFDFSFHSHLHIKGAFLFKKTQQFDLEISLLSNVIVYV